MVDFDAEATRHICHLFAGHKQCCMASRLKENWYRSGLVETYSRSTHSTDLLHQARVRACRVLRQSLFGTIQRCGTPLFDRVRNRRDGCCQLRAKRAVQLSDALIQRPLQSRGDCSGLSVLPSTQHVFGRLLLEINHLAQILDFRRELYLLVLFAFRMVGVHLQLRSSHSLSQLRP